MFSYLIARMELRFGYLRIRMIWQCRSILHGLDNRTTAMGMHGFTRAAEKAGWLSSPQSQNTGEFALKFVWYY